MSNQTTKVRELECELAEANQTVAHLRRREVGRRENEPRMQRRNEARAAKHEGRTRRF